MANKSLLEIAKSIFREEKKDMTFKELWEKVAKLANIPDSQKQQKMVSFYTTLTTDGGFFYDKMKKTWYLVSLQKIDEVKKNRTEYDDFESDKDDGDDSYIEEEDTDIDDETSNELKKSENNSDDTLRDEDDSSEEL